MDSTDFDFQFYSDIPNSDDGLRREAERRLRDLIKGHSDMIGASVAVEQFVNKTTPFVYRARAVVFVRPDNLCAEERADTPEGALQGALDGVIRQVRERRDRRREERRKRARYRDDALSQFP